MSLFISAYNVKMQLGIRGGGEETKLLLHPLQVLKAIYTCCESSTHVSDTPTACLSTTAIPFS